jgi:micrococcal nuclease
MVRLGERKIFLLAALLILLRFTTGNTTSFHSEPFPEIARCIRVIDGDSLVVKIGSEEKVVRLIGVDAPEKNEPLYCKAKRRLEEIVLNKHLILKKDVRETDKYGRALRYAYVEGRFVNAFLLEEGLAVPEIIPPDVAQAKKLLSSAHNAQKKALGLWKLRN